MRRLHYWFRHSLANQIMVYALFSILIFSLVVGGGSFLVVHRLFQQQVEAQLRADLQWVSLELQHLLGDSTVMLQQLAISPLLSNALVDSIGRETYLKPFFMEHRLAKQQHTDLLLVDFRGQTLLSTNTSMKDEADDSSLIARALTERIPVAAISNKAILVIIYPIIFPVTGTTEGALVYRVYLTALVQAIGKQLNIRFNLTYPDSKISSEPINDESLIELDETLALTAPLDHLAFKITAAKLRDQALAPLYMMIQWYLIVASVLLLAAIWLARGIARHVTSGLLTLVEAANAITHADDLADHLMIIPSDDEIGRLALALNHLIQRLRQFYLKLEDKVTERTMALIQAEAVARQSSNYARSLIEASLDPLITINAQGKISDVNKATELITGISREQLVGSDFSGYFIDSQRARRGYQQVFSAGQLIDYPLTIRHVSGQSTEVVYNFSVYSNEHDEVEGIFAAARDVTRQKQIEDELKASEEKFRSMIEVSPVPMALNDDKTITYLNRAFTQTFGYSIEDIPTLADWWLKAYPDPDYRCWVKSAWQTTLEQAEREHQPVQPIEYNICLKNGSFKTVALSAAIITSSLRNEHLVVLYDISDRKKNEIDLRIAATVFESQEGMLVTDANMNILRVNSAFTQITGYSADDVIGKNPRLFQSGRHDAHFYAAMWESINRTGTWQGEIWNQRKNGEVYPEHLTITAVKDQDNVISNYVATLTDITLSKEAVEKIEHLAFYDPLTGLPNRRLLQDRLKPALASSHRSGRQGALLFIDMDNFKTLNDTLGHDMGDLLLQQVAQRLESCVREGDTVARLGGDEFVVMLEDLNEYTLEAASQTEVIGNKLLAILNRPYQLAMHEYRSTPSIGAVVFNGQGQSSDELLKQADIAMYQAKASGRNALRFFDPQMQASITARVALEEDLRRALEEDQFILYYQPQVNHNNQTMGAEVLIRWQHPMRGLVSPAEFIPLAEETGLILTIGRWVMETACAQLKNWEASEHAQHLQLAVNVSARQFHQSDFVEQVGQILRHNTINPNRLKLELTESLVLDDIGDTILKMNALRKMGVRFSMDDFGTGYSSLSSLKQLPLDQLKIDQSFVRDLSIDQDDATIVETIIAMANKLNIEVIAEGVETEVQRTFLEQHDCLLFQGYLFSKPVPIEQFEGLLKKKPL